MSSSSQSSAAGEAAAGPSAVQAVNQPQQPMMSMQPQQPMMSMQPQQPMMSMQPQQSMMSTQPQQPMMSMQPQQPMMSMQPQQPMMSMQPQQPMHQFQQHHPMHQFPMMPGQHGVNFVLPNPVPGSIHSPAGSMFSSGVFSPGASPYFHFPAPAPKRGVGRPPGSKNKKRASEVDPDFEPPVPRRRSNGFRDIPIPEVHEWDYEIATNEGAACSKCNLNKAMFLVEPCNEYGFCLECLERHEATCRAADVPVSCIGCKKPVVGFVKYFRATLGE